MAYLPDSKREGYAQSGPDERGHGPSALNPGESSWRSAYLSWQVSPLPRGYPLPIVPRSVDYAVPARVC